MIHPPSIPGRPAFSIVEAAVSVVVVGAMLVVGLTMVGEAAKTRTRQEEWRRADLLARTLMAEILRQKYDDPDGQTALGVDRNDVGTNRATWDDLDDYENYTQTNPTDPTGKPVEGYTGWRWGARVRKDSPLLIELGSLSIGTDRGLIRITVTAVSPRGFTRSLTAMRSRWGTYEMTPGVGQSVGTTLSLEIAPEAAGRAIVGDVELLNTPGP